MVRGGQGLIDLTLVFGVEGSEVGREELMQRHLQYLKLGGGRRLFLIAGIQKVELF